MTVTGWLIFLTAFAVGIFLLKNGPSSAKWVGKTLAFFSGGIMLVMFWSGRDETAAEQTASPDAESVCEAALNNDLGRDKSFLGRYGDHDIVSLGGNKQRVTVYLSGAKVGEMCPARWKGSCVIDSGKV